MTKQSFTTLEERSTKEYKERINTKLVDKLRYFKFKIAESERTINNHKGYINNLESAYEKDELYIDDCGHLSGF